MSRRKPRPRKVTQGSVVLRVNGSLRVFVDAGIDPVSGKRHRLYETIPAGEPDKEAKADAARVRLIDQVNERRNPKTEATVRQLIERYLDQHTGAASTVANYRRDFRKHIEPFLGAKPVAEVDADVLDSLYRELRRCSEHCRGRYVEHRTDTEHVCDGRCGPHRCRPLGASGIRQVHFILSGACRKAVKWKWVSENPVQDAEPPPMKPPTPAPPTAEEAAKLVNEAIVADLDWATMVWLAMTTGIRRHELCALRWSDVRSEDEHVSVWIRRGISKDEQGIWAEQDTKTHQQRLVTLDAETVQVLRRHRQRYEESVTSLDAEPSADAFLFSPKIDYSAFLTPSAVTQRFGRLADRLGIVTTIHKLRHYSATELIKAGVDINTVAGRLGHGGGGATTLRVYTAFVSEADQRAAGKLMTRLPASNWEAADPVERAKTDPRKPFERIAAALRARHVPTWSRVAEREGSSGPIRRVRRDKPPSHEAARGLGRG